MRNFKLLVMLVIGVILFASCIYGVKITLMMWGGVVEENEVKGYIEAFNRIHPDIEVEIIRPADYWPKLMSMIAAQIPPDVFYMGFPEFVKFHAMGALLDLQPYIDNDSTFNEDDFFPGLLDAFKDVQTGHVYGVPKDWSTYVVYYNKEMFRKAGLPTPNELFGYGKWTWDDLLKVAEKLTKDGVYGIAVDAGRWKIMPPQWGAEWVKGFDKVVVDSPEFAEAIQFYANLWLKHHVAPDMAEQAEMSPADRFANQKAAMYICGRWMTMKFKELPFEWDIAPLPYHKKMYTWVDLVAYCVARDSKHPDAAWKLVRFLTGVEGQKLVAEAGHAVSARRSVAYSPAFVNALAERGIHNTVHLIPYYERILVFNHWSEIWTILNRALEPAWMGEKSAAEVLKEAQEEIDSLLK